MKTYNHIVNQVGRVKFFTLLVGFVLISTILVAAPFKNLPLQVKQPDGSIVNCLVSGDEFHNWLHDAEGFTIIQHPSTGYYVYAVHEGDKVKASDYIVGKYFPSDIGLKPYVNIANELVARRRDVMSKSLLQPAQHTKGLLSAQYNQKGTVKSGLTNLVIFVKFADDSIEGEPFQFYQDIYNNEEQASLYHYYKEVTYGQLDVQTHFVPQPSDDNVVWYRDSKPRTYFQPYNETTNPEGYDPDATSGDDSRREREHQLLKRTVEAVADQIPSEIQLDQIGDGHVDCVSFIISGGPDGWNELLWPHRWSLYSYEVKINGLRVWDYTFQLQYTYETNRVRLGTIAHEMFHVVGAPDLYRYENDAISPVGIWDLMASTTNIPQQMTAYMKYAYGGWIDDIPLITESGTYSMSPLQEGENIAFKIPSSETHSEFYMVEFRDITYQYDTSLPGSGIIVYRINDHYGGVGNADGPPDELYVYRPGGTLTVNGNINNAFFNQAVGRTAINSQTSPSPFLSDGSQGGLLITNIGSVGQTISFDVELDYDFPLALRFYKNNGRYTLGANAPKEFSVAIKFSPEDLDAYIGQYFTKVDFFINDGGGNDVTLLIWKGSGANGPGELVYEQNVSDEVVLSGWTVHSIKESVQIESGSDYWIGYNMKATGGYPIGFDYGPLVQGKGGWIMWGESWQQIADLGDFDQNLLIAAVVQSEPIASSTAMPFVSSASLRQNYPNPASHISTIEYSLEIPSFVSLGVYNMLGQKVADLVSKYQFAGGYQVELDTQGLPEGVYVYRLTLDEGRSGIYTKRMVISR